MCWIYLPNGIYSQQFLKINCCFLMQDSWVSFTWKYCHDSLCRCWSPHTDADPVQSALPWRPMFLSSLFLPQFCSFSSHTFSPFSPAIILPLRQTNSHQFCLDFIFSSLQSLLSLSPFSNSDSSKPNQTIQNSFAPLHFAILLPNQTNYSELTFPLNLRWGAK